MVEKITVAIPNAAPVSPPILNALDTLMDPLLLIIVSSFEIPDSIFTFLNI